MRPMFGLSRVLIRGDWRGKVKTEGWVEETDLAKAAGRHLERRASARLATNTLDFKQWVARSGTALKDLAEAVIWCHHGAAES